MEKTQPTVAMSCFSHHAKLYAASQLALTYVDEWFQNSHLTFNKKTKKFRDKIFYHRGTPHLTRESELVMPSGPRCEADTITSWLQKKKGSKVLIWNGGFNLVVRAIIQKLLHWTPLIHFVIWNGSHGSTKSISLKLIQTLNMWSPTLLFSAFLFNFLFHSFLSVSWKWIQIDVFSRHEACPLTCCEIDLFLFLSLFLYLLWVTRTSMPFCSKYEHT